MTEFGEIADRVGNAERDRATVAIGREWLRICAEEGSWPDLTPAQARRLPAAQVIRGVAQHWGGGLTAFVQDCDEEIRERRAEYARAAAERCARKQAQARESRTR